jgi:adenosylcobinamide-GDP ribazoletransferase
VNPLAGSRSRALDLVIKPVLKLAGNLVENLVAAFQFLTRIPMPRLAYAPDSLSRSLAFFPVVGLALGAAAALVHRLLAPHLGRPIVALAVVLFLALTTGALHEDGLADAADGFGGGRDREHTLAVLRDSRIGSYGALALILSVSARVLLLSSIPRAHLTGYLVAAQTLSRWTSLPLSLLPAARSGDGQGARVAGQVSPGTLALGSALALGICAAALRRSLVAPSCCAVLVTALAARFFWRRLGGVTGDCFGAVIQLTEIAIYCCGAWAA